MQQERTKKQNKFKNISCKIQCRIDEVILSKQSNYFILVQFKSNSSQKSIKLRTQVSALTNRPKFSKNIFTFTVSSEPCNLKFGLMSAKTQLDCDANSAMVSGITSMPITIERLSQLPNRQYKSKMIFSDRGKQVGQFHLTIDIRQFMRPANMQKMTGKVQDMNKQERSISYNPLISRILYNEDVTDFNKLTNSIEALQKVLQDIHGELKKAKKQQAFFQKIYIDLQTDEQEIKAEINRLQKINSKIQYQLQSKQSMQNLKIQVQLLGQSQQGKKVLFQKLQYFQDRIYRQIQQNQKLSIQYKKIRPQLQKNLQKAEQHSKKLTGKQIQQFELQKNTDIIRSYDQLLYQFKCNQQTISSLTNMSKKSELTAYQAKILLSQVKYQVKLAQLNSYDNGRKNTVTNEQRLLKQIEKQVYREQDQKDKLLEHEEMVYKIKLSALQKQISKAKRRITELYAQQN